MLLRSHAVHHPHYSLKGLTRATLSVVAVSVLLIIVYISYELVIMYNNEEYKWKEEWEGFEEFSKRFECQSPEWCDTYYSDSKAVQERIFKLQHPDDCYQARFLVFPEEYVSGMGSSIHMRAFMMGIAVALNRTFILPDGAVWNYAQWNCPRPTFECYFEPLTSCNTSLHAPNWNNTPVLTKMTDHADERVVQLSRDRVHDKPEGFCWYYWVAPDYSGKDRFWWHAQLAKYTTRPTARTLQIVAEEQNRVFPNGVPHPLISMYVRHGDKWKEAAPVNFSQYMDLVSTNITKKARIRDIYLGTDDPTVIAQAREIQKQGIYRFYYIETAVRNITVDTSIGPLGILFTPEAYNLIRVSLADLFIQIQGDVFVGTRTSNWCRLIDELRNVNGKARVPFFNPETPPSYFIDH